MNDFTWVKWKINSLHSLLQLIWNDIDWEIQSREWIVSEWILEQFCVSFKEVNSVDIDGRFTILVRSRWNCRLLIDCIEFLGIERRRIDKFPAVVCYELEHFLSFSQFSEKYKKILKKKVRKHVNF